MTDNLIEMDFSGPSRMIGSEIRAELGRQGRSQRWLSEQLFVNQAWVSRRISPTSDVELTLEELVRMADALRVPIQRFLSVFDGPDRSTLVRSYVTRARRALVRWNRRRRLGPLAVVVELDEHRLARAA